MDRLVLKPELRSRLTDSVETALREGKGVLLLTDESGGNARVMSELNACHHCGLSFGELTPAHFSFNNPLGMCPDCNGLGTKPEMDPDPIVPDPARTIREGAVEPWSSGMVRGEGWTAEFVEQLAKAFDIDLDVPWSKLGSAERDIVLYGTRGKKLHDRVELGREMDHGVGRDRPQAAALVPPPRARRSGSTTPGSSRRSPVRRVTQERLRPKVPDGGEGATEEHRGGVGGSTPIGCTGVLAGDAAHSGGGTSGARAAKRSRAGWGSCSTSGCVTLTLDQSAATLSGGEASGSGSASRWAAS